jgi:hypothetical protein
MRLSRSTGVLSGGLIMLLGLWGALIPFVGPYFDYSFGVNSTWHYTADRLWLCILPGAVAFVGGFLLLVTARRSIAHLASWLVLLAGAWFVVGPSVSLTWESGAGPIGRPLFGTTRQMLELLGYFYALGAILVALAGISLGRFATRRRPVEAPARERPAAAAAPVGAGAAAPVGAGARTPARARPRRRILFGRRREAHEVERARAVEAERASTPEAQRGEPIER